MTMSCEGAGGSADVTRPGRDSVPGNGILDDRIGDRIPAVTSRSSVRVRDSAPARKVFRRTRGPRTEVRSSGSELGVLGPSPIDVPRIERSPRSRLVSEHPKVRSRVCSSLGSGRPSAPLTVGETLSKAVTRLLVILRAASGELTRAALLARARLRAGDALTAVSTLIARGLVIRAGSGRSRDPFRFRAADDLSRIGRV